MCGFSFDGLDFATTARVNTYAGAGNGIAYSNKTLGTGLVLTDRRSNCSRCVTFIRRPDARFAEGGATRQFAEPVPGRRRSQEHRLYFLPHIYRRAFDASHAPRPARLHRLPRR